MKRRDRKTLERAIASAAGARSSALAHYRLALFHDNNRREGEAIAHYRRALSLGLRKSWRVPAMAWLASSLYKTGHPRAALKIIHEARSRGPSVSMRGFLENLERRILRFTKRQPP